MMLALETAIVFFQRDPSLLPLYRQVEAAILKRLPETTLRVGKSQIAFRNRYNYAFVSLPTRLSLIHICCDLWQSCELCGAGLSKL